MGLLQKLVIADRLAIYVNAAYGNPDEHTGLTLAVATMFFAFQIYCDFSGYSDIAIGAARVMGYDLMKNFNRPYLSASISEFWSRWHISLSTWFKDYLYISMGGNRVPIPRWYFNLFFTFLISGLWHGANWTYIIWGALNGFYLVFALIRTRYIDKQLEGKVPLPVWIKKTGNILVTFILICFSWIFFRAESVQDAFMIVKKIFTLNGPLFTDFTQMFYGLVGLAILMAREIKHEYFKNVSPLLEHRSPVVRYATYMVLIALILLIGVFDGSQFIYFQF